MHFEVPLFGELFVTTLDRAYVENLWSDSVLVHFMNPQPILASEALWAESAMEEWRSVLSPP
jgi:hypothetical protein